MSTNTKQVLDAAKPFTESNDLVSYLVNAIKFLELETKNKIQDMRARMDVLEHVIQGDDGYHYQYRSDISAIGTDMDINQAKIFEMTGTLVIVLNDQCGTTIEW